MNVEGAMSVFTPAEVEHLRSQRRGLMATVGPDGQPHIVPVTYRYNEDEDAIDVGGIDFGTTKKWRDARANPKVTFLVEDVVAGPPRQAHAIEIRGEAEAHETGREAINPRFPNFAPQFIRLRPRRIVSWGLEGGEGFRLNARNVR
jgi:pyridoxamine 5'-phosphate oxidase family protein